MDKEEATLTVGRVFSRYPSATLDEARLAVWTEEFAERFARERGEDVTRVALAYCRANPSQFAPSLDVLCSWVRDRLHEEADAREKRLRIEAPPMRREAFSAGMRELFAKLGANKIGRPMPDVRTK
jgi:hypothetical protein